MGRLKSRRAETGFILLDVLVSLFIVLLGFGVVLGGMNLTMTLAAKQNVRVRNMIEQRNADAAGHKVVYQKE
jgi:hypothetical protein